MRASILEAPARPTTGQLAPAQLGDVLLVSPYTELSGYPLPSHWREQPDVVAACSYIGQFGESVEPQRQLLEARIDARTQAIAGFISEALASSRFCDEIVVALIRSKTIESIAGKASRKPEAMYDVHAMQLVTNGEDPSAAQEVLEHLRITTGTPAHRPNGRPAVATLGNPYSGDGFSGQQAKLVTLVEGQLVLAEVQAYTPSEYVTYWETRPSFETNRGYGSRPPHENVALPRHRTVAFRNLASAGLKRFLACD